MLPMGLKSSSEILEQPEHLRVDLAAVGLDEVNVGCVLGPIASVTAPLARDHHAPKVAHQSGGASEQLADLAGARATAVMRPDECGLRVGLEQANRLLGLLGFGLQMEKHGDCVLRAQRRDAVHQGRVGGQSHLGSELPPAYEIVRVVVQDVFAQAEELAASQL